MIGADFWDEISCEWGHIELDIPADSDPRTIIRALDAAVAEPVGFIPPREEWHLISTTIIESKLAIHCRSRQGTLGLIIVNLDGK